MERYMEDWRTGEDEVLQDLGEAWHIVASVVVIISKYIKPAWPGVSGLMPHKNLKVWVKFGAVVVVG